MKKYIIALLTLPLCCSFNYSLAQSKKGKIEKEVTVEVDDKNGEIEKNIKVVIKGKDGEEKIMKWSGKDENEMPAEIKEHMKDVNIVIETGEGQDMDIEKEIKINIDKDSSQKKVIEIRKSVNGEEKIMKWTGEEGEEIPEEFKKEMEEAEIIGLDKEGNIEIIEDNAEAHVVRIKKMKKEEKGQKRVKIRRKVGDEEVQVFEWDGEGEMPKEVEKIIEEQEIDIKDGNVVIYSDKDLGGKPKLGIMIENHIDGVEVIEVVEGSVAEKAGLEEGDIIFQIGKKHIGSTLQLTETLKKSGAGSSVNIKVLRGGKKMKVKATME